MHTMTCTCAKCGQARATMFPPRNESASAAAGRLLSEQEEMELAMELLEVSDEQEWEQFLGKVFKRIGRGIGKVGKFVGRKVLPKLGGALKGLAKKALPFVGGALGSFIPIPGVGTAIGTAVGSAVGNALEMEFGELEQEDGEFEMARRFVRIAATAAERASTDSTSRNPDTAVRKALIAAARQHLPRLDLRELEAGQAFEEESEFEDEGRYEAEFEDEGRYEAEYEGEDEGEYEDEGESEGGYQAETRAPARAMSGRWLRRGTRIVLVGV